MSYSRSSVQQLLAAVTVLDQQLGFPRSSGMTEVRVAADSVMRSDEPLTALEAHRRLTRIAGMVRRGERDAAKVAADQLHADALQAIDRLPMGCAEAIELAGLALKTIEVL